MSDPIQTIAFVSLGCPKNLVDSERMLGLLAGDGLTVTGDAEGADAIVINTCGFLEASKTESMGEIHRAIRLKEKGKCKRVVVAGCLVQRHKTKLLAEAPGIDRLVGVFDRENIVEAVRGNGDAGEKKNIFWGSITTSRAGWRMRRSWMRVLSRRRRRGWRCLRMIGAGCG